MSVQLPPTVEFERRGDVGVWQVTDVAEFFRNTDHAEMGEQHYADVASDDRMTATVVEVQNATALGTDMSDFIDHVATSWAQLASEAACEKLAYVGEGVAGRTVSSKIEQGVQNSAVAIKSFTAVEPAVEWCQDE